MDMALRQGVNIDFDNKLRTTVDMFRLSKIEKMLSDCLESMPNENPINYVGELNKSDVMH